MWSMEYWLHFQKFVTNSVDTVKTLYRLDGLSIIEDTIAVLHKAVNRWRTKMLENIACLKKKA